MLNSIFLGMFTTSHIYIYILYYDVSYTTKYYINKRNHYKSGRRFITFFVDLFRTCRDTYDPRRIQKIYIKLYRRQHMQAKSWKRWNFVT